MSSSILFPTNEYTTSSKSAQQIQKLMMPHFQTLAACLNHILTKGHPLQHQYAYKNFYKCAHETLQQVCMQAPNAEIENQMIIIESLQMLFCQDKNNQKRRENNNKTTNQVKDKVKGSDLTPDDLELVFTMVLDCLNNWNTASSQRLIDLAQKIIQRHPHCNHLVKIVQKTALDLGKPNQPIISRVIAGRLISLLPKYMDGMVKGEMVDILKRIHSDAQIQAKKAWVGQIFPKMISNCQLQFIELHLQEKIYQSVYDENQEVGLLALSTILKHPTMFSIEEQASRIIKLFLDSLTSKNQKICLMATSMMGQVYQKLENIVMRSQQNCVRFWRSVIELSQSKDQRILNNMIYNLPGIVSLAKKHYNIEPICDIYTELFYSSNSNKQLLSAYFHEMSVMFPGKKNQLKETVYMMFNQIFQECQEAPDQSFNILDNIIGNLYESREIFFSAPQGELLRNPLNQENGMMYMSQGPHSKQKTLPSIDSQNTTAMMSLQTPYFEYKICQDLCQYLAILLARKNVNSLKTFYDTVLKCYNDFPPDFNQQHLLPKIYAAIRAKTAHLQTVVKILVSLVSRDVSNNLLINNYVSRVNVQLSKSMKSYERQAAMMFFYHASFCFSIETFQEFKLGQKFLNLHNDRNFRNKSFFIRSLPRLIYFFTREQKIQNNIIIARLQKDHDQQIVQMMSKMNLTQTQQKREQIIAASKLLKQKEREKVALNGKRMSSNLRRDTKEIIKKEDILKKRIETKSKAKIVIKDVPKRKVVGKVDTNFRKNS